MPGPVMTNSTAPQARDTQRVVALGLVGVPHRGLRFRTTRRRRRRSAVTEVELVAGELCGAGHREAVERDAHGHAGLRVGRPHPRLEPGDTLGRRADADLRSRDRGRVPDLADRRRLGQDRWRWWCPAAGVRERHADLLRLPDQRARRAVAQIDGVPPAPRDLPAVRIERRTRGITDVLEPIPSRRRVRHRLIRERSRAMRSFEGRTPPNRARISASDRRSTVDPCRCHREAPVPRVPQRWRGTTNASPTTTTQPTSRHETCLASSAGSTLAMRHRPATVVREQHEPLQRCRERRSESTIVTQLVTSQRDLSTSPSPKRAQRADSKRPASRRRSTT